MIYIRRDTDSVLVRIEICHLAAFFRIEICRLAAFFNRRSIASHKKAARRQISIQTHACAHPMKKKQRDGRFKSRLEPALAQWKKAARRQISIQIRTFARPMKKKQRDGRFQYRLARSLNQWKKQRDSRFQFRLARSLAQWKKAARRQISIQTRAFARPMKKSSEAADFNLDYYDMYGQMDGRTDATNYNTPGSKWPRGNKNWEEMETQYSFILSQ